jgi:two-component system LytT family response regulator
MTSTPATPVRTLIADDEPIARAGLRRLLASVPWVEVIGEAANGPAALAAIEQLTPDLVFLDIQMPGLTGTDVVARLTHQPFVVFTTAYAEHAVHAFELGAVDYLLKPFGAERLAGALDRVRAALGASGDVPALDRLGEVLGARPLQRVFVRSGASIVPVPVSTVLWFEADGDYVIAQTAQRRHILTLSLAALEARLDARRFVRIHRTHIVNLDHVVAFRRHGRGGMTADMAGGVRLPVSRARAQELRKLGV